MHYPLRPVQSLWICTHRTNLPLSTGFVPGPAPSWICTEDQDCSTTMCVPIASTSLFPRSTGEWCWSGSCVSQHIKALCPQVTATKCKSIPQAAAAAEVNTGPTQCPLGRGPSSWHRWSTCFVLVLSELCAFCPCPYNSAATTYIPPPSSYLNLQKKKLNCNILYFCFLKHVQVFLGCCISMSMSLTWLRLLGGSVS